MDIAIVGLGRMGGNMAERLLRGGHRVVVHNRTPEKIAEYAAKGGIPAAHLNDIPALLPSPRIVWLMIPAGAAVDAAIDELLPLLAPGDLLIDGGNSRYKDSIERGKRVEATGVRFMDIGTSGGIWGLENGYCLMGGGAPESYALVRPILETLAAPGGQMHTGPIGSGHFVKMVHNGIEYGMMQAYAEGYELLEAAYPDLDLAQVSDLWMNGSVVRSWLLELIGNALHEDPKLDALSDWVADSGEGRWTVEAAIDHDVPATVLAHALFARFRSRQEASFGGKLLAAMRNQFGGHAVKKAGD
ncbi:MAG: 6-phosphogluconate dehydrogenase (decarboxylating) [Alphaproteobacteria bacterium CG_4_10_14_0_2_um_filter_63_37]|nr:MAG: 6-phosphogluconate dehydrogenase (decarboxylating) [Alphaproteobacteria bacterium CG_4_10_14_0_2_um_filter_63_37]